MRSDKHKPGARHREDGKRESKDVEERRQREAATKRSQERRLGDEPLVRRRDQKTGQTIH
ncbi:MAG TPA: hypothetical protein VGD42_00315 [Lysobacter sp.]